MLKIYTDGSAQAKHSGWGYVVYKDNELIDAQGELIADATNNKMELIAIIQALKKYGTTGWDSPIIYTDSTYAQKSLTQWYPKWRDNGWQGTKGLIENLDLIKMAVDLLEHDHYAIIEKVSGHSGIEGNEFADAIATGLSTPQSILANWDKKKIVKEKKL